MQVEILPKSVLVGREGLAGARAAAGDASVVDANGAVSLAVQAHQTQHLEPTGKIALTPSSSPSGRLGVLDGLPKEI
jgi:hypothetical protein